MRNLLVHTTKRSSHVCHIVLQTLLRRVLSNVKVVKQAGAACQLYTAR